MFKFKISHFFVWGKYVDNFLEKFKISSWFQLLSLFVTQASSSLSLKDNVWEITGDRNLLGVRKKKKTPKKTQRKQRKKTTFTFSLVPCQRNIFPSVSHALKNVFVFVDISYARRLLSAISSKIKKTPFKLPTKLKKNTPKTKKYLHQRISALSKCDNIKRIKSRKS